MNDMHIDLPVNSPATPMAFEPVAPAPNDATVFDSCESNIRTYCRSFPVVFARASGAEMFDERGRRYLDFFAGAGALNYGHNPPYIRDLLVEHLERDGILHALDMYTDIKRRFIAAF